MPFWSHGSKSHSADILGRPHVDVASSYKLSADPRRAAPGETYPAQDKVTRQEVDVKTFLKTKLEKKKDVADLRREVAIMHHLGSHPNIVTLKGAYEDKNYVHIVLEPRKRSDIFERIEQKGVFSEKAAARCMRDLLQGVEFCHSHNVVHRDIKAESLVFADNKEDAQLKITDFSMATFQVPGEVLGDNVGCIFYVAPEVVKLNYGRECDIWSCGVILYMMLSAVQPFSADKDEQIYKEILRAKPDMESEPWPRVSRPAKELVMAMLHPDPKKRITAADALKHPWLTGGEASDVPLGARVVQGIRSMAGVNKMMSTARTVIACNLPKSEIEELKKIFKGMDKDGSGFITYKELKVGLRKLGTKLPEEELRTLMDAADADGDGRMNYVEFISSTIQLNDEEQIRKAFDFYDEDGNGSITLVELKGALGRAKVDFTDGDIEKILAEADSDGNGVIDYFEFKDMMLALK